MYSLDLRSGTGLEVGVCVGPDEIALCKRENDDVTREEVRSFLFVPLEIVLSFE